MEDIDWSKLDRGMRAIFRNYLDRQENPAEKPPATLPDVRSADHELTVLIEHDGSLDAALASSINFEFQSQQGLGVAQGSLRIGDLPQICAVDAVKLVRFGQSRKRRLSQSVTQLNVEATTAALTDGIWFYDPVTDTFSGNTGKDVIIGIIDDGIDPTHPCFLTTDGRASRIVSIWDQGLTPQDEESSPNAALLQLNGNGSTEPYGVEYNSDVLNDVARRIIEPRTSGDNSHGTHVAGIAAGNGAQSSLNTELEENNTRTGNIGIAPEARLIIVRHIDVTSSIGDVIRERDALNYIVNKAASLGGSPAVVINGSYGGELHPHDGRDFQGSATSENTMHDVFHGQRGRIGVFAAGNGAADNAHLKVTFPAANRGQVRIPFTINDSRTNPSSTDDLLIEMVYRSSVNGVKAWTKLPGVAGYFGGNQVGASSGTALGHTNYEGTFGNRHRVLHWHNEVTATSTHGNATRRNIQITFKPRRNTFFPGTYTLQLEGPAGQEVHIWIDASDPDLRIVFDRTAIGTTDGVVIDTSTKFDSPGQSPDVFAVGSYRYHDSGLQIMDSISGRGPLLSYDANPVIGQMPNVAAPGYEVYSASNNVVARMFSYAAHYVPDRGTSMAAPHITGLIALMLQVNKQLNMAEILEDFTNSRPTPPLALTYDPSTDFDEDSYSVPSSRPQADANAAGLGRLDFREVLENVSAPTP